METEARLRSNGYVRVVFRTALNKWTGRPVRIIVFATRTPGKGETGDEEAMVEADEIGDERQETPVGDAEEETREALEQIAKLMDRILVKTELNDEIHKIALEAQNIADDALSSRGCNKLV